MLMFLFVKNADDVRGFVGLLLLMRKVNNVRQQGSCRSFLYKRNIILEIHAFMTGRTRSKQFPGFFNVVFDSHSSTSVVVDHILFLYDRPRGPAQHQDPPIFIMTDVPFGPPPTNFAPPPDGVWTWPAPHFSLLLSRAAANPDAVPKKFVFHETDEFFALYDGYPKAKVHLVLLPKASFGKSRVGPTADIPSILAIPDESFLRKLEDYTQFIVTALENIKTLNDGFDKTGTRRATTFRHGVHLRYS